MTLAQVLSRGGDPAEAERLARDVVATYTAALGTYRSAYAGALGYLDDVLARRGALDSAEAPYREAVAIRAAHVKGR